LKNGLQQGGFRLSALVDCFERTVEFVVGQFDHFRKEADPVIVRDLSQATTFEFVFTTVEYNEISGTKGQVMFLLSGGARPLRLG